MPKRGCRKQAPGERTRSSPGTRLNDQAAQCSTRGNINNNQNGLSPTRYTMSGNNVPYAVTFAPASLQQAQNGFLGPAPGEGHQPPHHVEQEDELFMQRNSTQVQSDEPWQYNIGEDRWPMEQCLEHSGTQFAEYWGAADQDIGANSDLLSADTGYEDVLRGIDSQAETVSEVSRKFSIDPRPDVPMSDPIFTGSATTPPWSGYNPNDLERQQPRQDWSMPIDGSGTSTTSRSTHIEDTARSGRVIVDGSLMSSISSYSQHDGDLADIGLAMRPGGQARRYPEIQFDYANSHQTDAGVTRGFHSLPAEREGHETPPYPRSIDRSLLSPLNLSLLDPRQTYRADDRTASTTSSTLSTLNNVHCRVCGVRFSGKHRKNNLARHRRTQHNGGPVLPCLECTCNKVYKRQDARLKHVRKHHPGLALDAVPRLEQRRGFQNTGTAPVWPETCA